MFPWATSSLTDLSVLPLVLVLGRLQIVQRILTTQMMTPSPSPDALATPLPSRPNVDLPPVPRSTQELTFSVQSIHSSVAMSEILPEERKVNKVARSDDEQAPDTEESRRLEDALRAAMMMSGEIDNEKERTVRTHRHQEASTSSNLALPVTPAQPNILFGSPSRSVSPSASASSISLSLSTPASPVSLSSVPASMSLSMDLDTDSSTSWSLHESSGESRSGSPLFARDRRTGVGTSAAQDRTSSGAAGSGPLTASRHPYAFSRRNTATIPQIIRTSSGNQPSQEGESMHSTGTYSGSFQSDATTQDIHSRSHWAVQESLERQRYQGDLFELVLPILDLPGASVTSTIGATKDADRLNTEQAENSGLPHSPSTGQTAETIPQTDQDDGSSSCVLSIVLCGTNRTTNIFLREIMQDPRFDVYKLPPQTSASGPGNPPVQDRGKQGGRTARTSNRSDGPVSGKEAYYTVGVYAVNNGLRSSQSSADNGGKRLVAKIKVFGKGQQGNLERVRIQLFRPLLRMVNRPMAFQIR